MELISATGEIINNGVRVIYKCNIQCYFLDRFDFVGIKIRISPEMCVEGFASIKP